MLVGDGVKHRAKIGMQGDVQFLLGLLRDDGEEALLKVLRAKSHGKLRLPPELRAQIDDAAKRNSRSVNGEIVARLEASFVTPADWELGELRAEIVSLKAQMTTITNRLKALEDR